jgi:NAD(P)-dependent dehydrogenase (short-subunit alcohol dehydrogenase family)
MSAQPHLEDDAGLAGKVAIVTGGGAAGEGIGNGRAASILLARAGTKVLVVDRDLALAERTVAMIAAEGGTAAASPRQARVALLQRLRGRKVKRAASAKASAKRSLAASRFPKAGSARAGAASVESEPAPVTRGSDGSRPAAAR